MVLVGGLVDPGVGGQGWGLRGLPNEPFGVVLVGGVESGLAGAADVVGAAVVDISGRVQRDA